MLWVKYFGGMRRSTEAMDHSYMQFLTKYIIPENVDLWLHHAKDYIH